MPCLKTDNHKEYIKYKELEEDSEKYKKQLRKCLTKNVFIESDFLKLHSFLLNMSDLTGLLLILSDTEVECYGTGFIVKLRRQRDNQCPCPLKEEHGAEKTDHATVTISTAYHIFNEEDDEAENNEEINQAANKYKDKRYDEVKEIWDKYQTEFKLDYNGTDKERPQLKENKDLPTLYGHKLIEMDKDIDLDCDWCAIECVTHNMELIDTLEKTISDYQKGLAKLYKKSQKPRYKDVNLVVIIGHPHNWAKRISIGQTRKSEKEILKEVRSRQTWCRYSYDNITCTGSSGSPIFKWGQPITGFGYWFGHPHNHSEGSAEYDSDNKLVYFGKSTIGVENIY